MVVSCLLLPTSSLCCWMFYCHFLKIAVRPEKQCPVEPPPPPPLSFRGDYLTSLKSVWNLYYYSYDFFSFSLMKANIHWLPQTWAPILLIFKSLFLFSACYSVYEPQGFIHWGTTKSVNAPGVGCNTRICFPVNRLHSSFVMRSVCINNSLRVPFNC